ncbi:40S ribosomal protein S4 [Manacus vitellinus]|uniref:40S ribosomal protein S4 n=1 Tax=Manacus vitellinus TaxID=328815 RepID=UPI00115C5837|nr:40S ribosomal protein S4 [Manacus vitellinus]
MGGFLKSCAEGPDPGDPLQSVEGDSVWQLLSQEILDEPPDAPVPHVGGHKASKQGNRCYKRVPAWTGGDQDTGETAANAKNRKLCPVAACVAAALWTSALGFLLWGWSVLLEPPAEGFCPQAPRPSTGPHKLRECLPLIIFLRNRLKYALTGDEVKKICMQRFIKIDGKVRTDITYPAGFMDVISIEKTGEHFRLVYDTKGRFAVHRITAEEAKYKLCKVRKIFVGTKGIPHLVTHDARTIRYPDPLIKVNDTVQIDLETGKITDFIKFDTGRSCIPCEALYPSPVWRAPCVAGPAWAVVGFCCFPPERESSAAIHVSWCDVPSSLLQGNKPWISLPRGKGIRLTIAEERDKRLAAKQSSG